MLTLTTADLLATVALVPAFAGFAISLFLLWRTELRRPKISLELLSAPTSWKTVIARHGSAHAAPSPADADYLGVHGRFPAVVSNDGPRGGALWDVSADLRGLDNWRLRAFTTGHDLPYALEARSCEGWSHTAITIACDFDRLSQGIRELHEASDITLTIHYASLGWLGHASQRSATIRWSTSSILASLRAAASGLDLSLCQIVPAIRSLVAQRFAEFDLPEHELDFLAKWAMLPDAMEIVVQSSNGQERLALKRSTGQIDAGWAVGLGQPHETLSRLREIEQAVIEQIPAMRTAAVQP